MIYKIYVAYNIRHYISFKDQQNDYLSHLTRSSKKKPDGSFNTARRSPQPEHPVTQVHFPLCVLLQAAVLLTFCHYTTKIPFLQFPTTFPHFPLSSSSSLVKDGQALLKVSSRPLTFPLTLSLDASRFFLLPRPKATVLF